MKAADIQAGDILRDTDGHDFIVHEVDHLKGRVQIRVSPSITDKGEWYDFATDAALAATRPTMQ